MIKIPIFAMALLAAGGAHAASIVVNGGFEGSAADAAPTGWTITGTTEPWVRVSPSSGITAFEGSQQLQFRGNTGDTSISQALTTVALTEYDLSFALAALNGPAGLSVLVTVTSGGGTLGDLFSETFTFASINAYTTYDRTFTASNTTSTLRFLETSSNTDGKDPYLDDVSVTAVPEPSAFTLLGIGLVALMLRRRRS
ncbi:MAG: DUF642 domain-containing protein [Akkermansiaceae bacterium]|jgi:hypothetical protein|nr:DUF642 domain-containing protein [Akkermansiaceae bacterium]MDP4791999.1 DUF642 domain-containing protein [Verrucomicrobiales bacterium]MDP4848389.1 DUF642 domain-containing protein [Akkermansiaceae bacterium]MDP4898355.1 DUF642 domain-containing protein [Akkermansiaceae bacterium]MDP4996614.1 DUF642 domain-containing protein [Akkermansiaceae bacterium]